MMTKLLYVHAYSITFGVGFCTYFMEKYWNYNTLITSLPDQSKVILSQHTVELIFHHRAPAFNYPSFCKELSFVEVNDKIGKLFGDQKSIVTQELYKLLMNQIHSLKKLLLAKSPYNPQITTFDCLRDLSELILGYYIS